MAAGVPVTVTVTAPQKQVPVWVVMGGSLQVLVVVRSVRKRLRHAAEGAEREFQMTWTVHFWVRIITMTAYSRRIFTRSGLIRAVLRS
jgi:hypothetical protein